MSHQQTTSLVWFRNDLRVADNTSLTNAIASGNRVVAVYCFDPRNFEEDRFGFKKTEKFRAQFLLESLENLRANLSMLNITLLTYCDKPEAVFPKLATAFSVSDIYLQKEWTTEETNVLERVQNAVDTALSFHEVYDQFLFHPEDIPYEIENIPKVFTGFRKKCEKLSSVRPPLPKPTRLPTTNRLELHTELPTIKDLGLEAFDRDTRSAFPFYGGEHAALERLDYYFWDSKKLSYYKNTRNGLVGTDYSSKFSPWLANGSISARTIYERVRQYEKEITKNVSTYWLIFELIWRDYFKYVSLKNGNHIFKIGGILEKEYEWKTDPHLVRQWIDGETASDFVNANMLELKHTGWMSNRGRQNVASYFAKDLLLDWRLGAAYFESMLLDYDVHSNYGNWMYVAGVGNDPRDRKFNVNSQAERYDGNGRFQKTWLQQTLF